MNQPEIPAAGVLTRRKILGWGGAGVLAGVTGYLAWPRTAEINAPAPNSAKQPSGSAPAPAAYGELPGALAGRNAFLPYLETEFRISSGADSRAAVCRLVEVSDEMAVNAPSARYLSYALLFAGPKGFAGQGSIYRLTHPQLEPLDVFLSPVGRSDESVYLEAVFSHQV